MPITLYQLTIPPFIRGLENLSHILSKASSSPTTPASKLLAARLHPTMQGLPYQIQRVSDTAKGAAVRVAGLEPISMPDTETTFEELQIRIASTIDILKRVKEDDMEGKEEQEVIINDYKFTATDYLLQFAVPNFYFHVVAAYAILRMEGVEVGKMDYLKGGYE
ncbi:MAG: hypothetical protein LQ346_004402 [Caloplaca aetnensis]|nr:MAG: hypothetical protein LQ346_004402 [Caloplaca aetnensis]